MLSPLQSANPWYRYRVGVDPYSGLVKHITDIEQSTGMETDLPLVNQALVDIPSFRGKAAVHH